MKKKLFLFLLVLIIVAAASIIYLNKVVLPIKIKSLIIHGLHESTHKKVTLDSVQFNIFKGLVLKNLIIYDGTKTIVSLKEGSCTFIILPIFKKNIIFQTIKLKSPVIFLQRRADNTVNLMDLFLQKEVKKEKPKFNVFVNKISITNGRIDFQDDTSSPVFTKSIDNLNAKLFLSLPVSVKFDLKAGIPANQRIEISASGEFNIVTTQLTSKIAVKNLSPREFLGYYRNLGISILEGTVDTLIDLNFKDDVLSAHADAKVNSLALSKGKINAKLNSILAADFKYTLKDKQITYSGRTTLSQSNISGLEVIGGINDISGEVKFNNKDLSSDKISANVMGIPLEAKVALTNFNNPSLNINIASLDLNSTQKALKDKFKLAIPADIEGVGQLSLVIASQVPQAKPPQINGYFDILKAIVKLDKVDSPIEDISGRIEFTQDQLRWPGLNFKYLGIPYSTNGTLINFQAPRVQLALTSADLSLESMLAINNKLIELSKFKGRYLGSEFSVAGNFDITNPAVLQTDISGGLNIDLKDIKGPLKKFQSQLEQIKPDGIVHVKFNLNGNINDFKSCVAEAELSSPSISAYGLKSQDFFLKYKQQENGVIELPLIHLSVYGGTVEGNAAMNMATEHLPYRINLEINNIKIEKLKMDTPIREKDIAGIIQAQVKLNGFSGDLSKLSGAGRILVTEGKLWELNLFKGLGKLIFAKEFAHIIFNEAYCGFIIQDKSISTDDLILKSNIAELSGTAKIGLDSSVDAAIKIHILDEMIPLTNTLRDMAMAIIGKADILGVIKISGTLQQPKYKFEPVIVDMIKGLKDSIFEKIFKK